MAAHDLVRPVSTAQNAWAPDAGADPLGLCCVVSATSRFAGGSVTSPRCEGQLVAAADIASPSRTYFQTRWHLSLCVCKYFQYIGLTNTHDS